MSVARGRRSLSLVLGQLGNLKLRRTGLLDTNWCAMRLIYACGKAWHSNSRTVGALWAVRAANIQAIDLAVECWLKELVLFQIAVKTGQISTTISWFSHCWAVCDFEIL